MRAFPEAYAQQLRSHYGHPIADQITAQDAIREAPLSYRPDQVAAYVDVRPVTSEGQPTDPVNPRKVFIVPGFGSGIVNKASFAAELAFRGREAILPDQNRKGILRDQTGRLNATYTAARDYLSVLEVAAGEEPADFITNSYGSLVLQEMMRLYPERFKDSRVALLAVSGSVEDQRLLPLGGQWLGMMSSESDQKRPMEFPDKKGVTGQASARTLAANPVRTALEVRDLVADTMDYEFMAGTVGSVAVLTYAEDKMFPDKLVRPMLSKAVEAGYVTWTVPVDSEAAFEGAISYGGAGAVHDDEQYNPSRVAAAALEFLS